MEVASPRAQSGQRLGDEPGRASLVRAVRVRGVGPVGRAQGLLVCPVDAAAALDLTAFHTRNQPFYPSMMVKVLQYAYATGVFSLRKIAAKLHEDVAFRLLAAGNQPAGRTIRDVRALHLKELGDLFVQVVQLAKEMGLVKLGTIAVDGTKVKSNASRHKAMSYGHMLKAEAELKAQIAALLQRAQAADQTDQGGPQLDVPAEIARRQDRLQAIQQARAT